MTQPRDPDTIQREIERTRAQLARTLDELANRASPKRVASRGITALTETPRGRAILGAAAALVVFMLARGIVRSIRH